MNNEEIKIIELSELTEEELKKVSGGGDFIIGYCASCRIYWDATNSKVCPKCGKAI